MEDRGILAAKLVTAGVFLSAAWTFVASVLFLFGTGLIGQFAHPYYQWWSYFVLARGNPIVAIWLEISGGIASGLVLGLIVALGVTGRRPLGPSLSRRWFGGVSAPIPGVTDNHGHAAWKDMKAIQERFPGPDPIYGGVVVGEAYRVDLDRLARRAFHPRDRKTWGRGGKAPLLIDPCHLGASHSLVFAGPGSYKSTCAVSTILSWIGSIVILDPSCELGDMLTADRERLGHAVHRIDLLSGVGLNALDWIDTKKPLAEADVLSVVKWVCGDGAVSVTDEASGRDFFASRGRALVACMLAHMLWDEELDPTLKTLATLRSGLSTPEGEMREVLRGIHKTSGSRIARDFAGTLMDIVPETFSGIYTNADEMTSWLSIAAFSGAVSGDSFKTMDMRHGKTTVFVQIPLAVLMTTPAVARVLIGALLNSVYEANGNLRGRVLFLLDEAARLGPMKVIETARDAGRKFGITLQLLYQSVGQLEQQWGKEGKRVWYDGTAHRTYAAIRDPETARELEEIFGTYGVMATSQGGNTGTSGKSFEVGSRSRGTNTSYHEISRPLIRRDELLNDCRTDEAFVVAGDGRIRCGRAIYFRRPEMVARVNPSRFEKRAE
jgi:type IV secretion system protein VirD4